jgi:hypothetical protein
MADDTPTTWPLSQVGEADVRMPNLYEILATVDAVPNQLMIDVLNLLEAEGTDIPNADPATKFLRKRNLIRGKYALASLILVRPRLVLGREPGEGEIGPHHLSWGDLEGLYYSFFLQGRRFPPLAPAEADDAGGASQPAPAGDDLPPVAE